MLEIIALIFICRKIGSIARAKGRTAIGYQLLAVALWLAFEFAGALVTYVAAMIITGQQEPNQLIAYAGAIAGALISLIFSIGLIKILPPKQVDTTPAGQMRVDHVPMSQGPGN